MFSTRNSLFNTNEQLISGKWMGIYRVLWLIAVCKTKSTAAKEKEADLLTDPTPL
jgi:hypothetical protein